VTVVDTPPAREALGALREVVRQARHYDLSKSIVLDLAEIRGREYYSGLIFELFADGVGYEVGRGGRYDDLIGRFGPAGPSTGFAVHLERVQQGLTRVSAERRSGAADVLVAAGPDRAAIRLARELRRRSLRVIVRTESESLTASAEHARALNIPWIIQPGPTAANVVLTNAATVRSRRLSPAAAVAAVVAQRAVGS
jgi:ATP phosphoribosyltransferase regulatory subunit